MSREIKVRMWGGSTPKMFYGEQAIECLCQQMLSDIENPTGYDHAKLHGSIFLQYTGLKDKNDKEIYEGDILTSLYKRDGCRGLYEVIWRNGGMFPKRHKEHQQKYVSVNMGDLDSCEIIGNIYENPELLK